MGPSITLTKILIEKITLNTSSELQSSLMIFFDGKTASLRLSDEREKDVNAYSSVLFSIS